MLKDSFYTIIKKRENTEKGTVQYDIVFASNHAVFSGHFPGNPVLPGVFIIQLVHELAEEMLGKKLRLASVKKVKFLSVVTPEKGNQITIELTSQPETEDYPIDATAFFMNQPCLKLNARFTAEP